MKCRYCGGNLSIQDEKCPYCLTPNPNYQKHRDEMSRFSRDYEKTREQVIKKSGIFAGFTVKITLIAVLAFLNILFLFLAMNSWEIADYFKTRRILVEVKEHRLALEKYEKERDYFGLAAYFDENGLYRVEELDDFYYISRICRNFLYVYQDVLKLRQEDAYETDIQRIERISENLAYLYESMEVKEYEPKEYYQGEHKVMVNRLTYDLQVLLQAYAGISQKEAAEFPEMSDGHRQLAMERRLSGNED